MLLDILEVIWWLEDEPRDLTYENNLSNCKASEIDDFSQKVTTFPMGENEYITRPNLIKTSNIIHATTINVYICKILP